MIEQKGIELDILKADTNKSENQRKSEMTDLICYYLLPRLTE